MPRRDESGSATAELVIVMPLFLLLLAVVVFVGRIESAHGDVEAAAQAGVSAAVVQPSAPAAQQAARQAVGASLAGRQLSCAYWNDTVELADFAVGGEVSVTVVCVANLSAVAAPGLPGHETLTASATSPVGELRIRPAAR